VTYLVDLVCIVEKEDQMNYNATVHSHTPNIFSHGEIVKVC